MGDKSDIEWTDATWNPVRGCTKISPGCKHCYAETFAERWRGVPGNAYEQGFDLRLVPAMLPRPLRWKRPRTIFVNSMSDLFHEGVPFEYIAAVFGVMAACPQHTFQVLTKRADRLPQFFAWLTACAEVAASGNDAMPWGGIHPMVWALAVVTKPTIDDATMQRVCDSSLPWPLPNVWLGVSVEDRKYGVPRIDHLRECPAAVRFLSIEPLLEDLGELDLRGIDWVIVGGESGPGARVFDIAWARSIVRQCRVAGVPVFVKQLGANPIESCVRCGGRGIARSNDGSDPDWCGECAGGTPWALALASRKGGDMAEWPADLRVREVPHA